MLKAPYLFSLPCWLCALKDPALLRRLEQQSRRKIVLVIVPTVRVTRSAKGEKEIISPGISGCMTLSLLRDIDSERSDPADGKELVQAQDLGHEILELRTLV